MNIIPLGTGKCSWFGGAADTGVGTNEGLGCIEMPDLQDWWFRRIFVSSVQWDNCFNLARNLNPNAYYCAMRWAYASFAGVPGEILPGYSREQIRRGLIFVTANGIAIPLQAADFGPNTDTGRLIDMSPGACKILCVKTDDEVSAAFVI